MLEPRENFIQKIKSDYDVAQLRKEVFVIMGHSNFLRRQKIKQFMLTNRRNAADPHFDGVGETPSLSKVELERWQESFDTFNPKYCGTYMEEVWRSFPFPVGRVRIMLLAAYSCSREPMEKQLTFHIPVQTNSGSFLVYPDHPDWYHLPSDGHMYRVHTYREHAAVNTGGDWRLHIVLDSKLGYGERPGKENMKGSL